MLNVLSKTAGVGAGDLIRAIETTIGFALMKHNRGTDSVRDLARGPGRLSAALAMDRRLDGTDPCPAGPLWLRIDGQALPRIIARGNRFVSGSSMLNR
jgi:DNA-3-methyladenine glycosylase